MQPPPAIEDWGLEPSDIVRNDLVVRTSSGEEVAIHPGPPVPPGWIESLVVPLSPSASPPAELKIQSERFILGAAMPIEFSAPSIQQLEGARAETPFGPIAITGAKTDNDVIQVWASIPLIIVGEAALLGFSRADLRVDGRRLPLTGIRTRAGEVLERGAQFAGAGNGEARLRLDTWTFASQRPVSTLIRTDTCDSD
jgi:hypothetical protein